MTIAIAVNLLTSDGASLWLVGVSAAIIFLAVLGTAALERPASIIRRLRLLQSLPTPSRNFVNRAQLLGELLAHLKDRRKSVRVFVLVGLDGNGKTQLALQHLMRARQYCAVSRFIEYQNIDEIGSGIGANLSMQVADGLERSKKRWLLVFDDVERWDQISRYVPQAGHGQVIITTSNRNWRQQGGEGKLLSVRSLKSKDAATMLMKVSKENDRGAALRVAQLLGGLPLAIEQAGAFVRAVPGQSLARYAARLSEDNSYMFETDVRLGPEMRLSLVWKDAEDYLLRLHGNSILLARCLGYMSDLELRADLLRDATASGDLGLGEEEVGVGLYNLLRFSLVDYDRNRHSVRMHRVVRQWFRDGDVDLFGLSFAIDALWRATAAFECLSLNVIRHVEAVLTASIQDEKIEQLERNSRLKFAKIALLSGYASADQGRSLLAARLIEIGYTVLEWDSRLELLGWDSRLESGSADLGFETWDRLILAPPQARRHIPVFAIKPSDVRTSLLDSPDARASGGSNDVLAAWVAAGQPYQALAPAVLVLLAVRPTEEAQYLPFYNAAIALYQLLLLMDAATYYPHALRDDFDVRREVGGDGAKVSPGEELTWATRNFTGLILWRSHPLNEARVPRSEALAKVTHQLLVELLRFLSSSRSRISETLADAVDRLEADRKRFHL